MSSSDAKDDGTTSYQPSEPSLCANGCGFFGTAANNNMCSKCYRDLRMAGEHAAPAKVMDKFVVTPAPPLPAHADEPAVRTAVGGEPAEPKRSNRCSFCQRKVGVVGFTCRCGSVFCGTHRYPEKHECGFDYKTAGKEEIAKANPVVKTDKLERI